MQVTVADIEAAREQRTTQRKRVLWSGVIEADGASWPCLILDLSATGAKIRIERAESAIARLPPPAHATVTLTSPRFETLRGKLVWRRHDLAGINFEESPARIAAVLARVLPLFHSDGSPIASDAAN